MNNFNIYSCITNFEKFVECAKDIENIEFAPVLFSSESDEFFDENGNTIYTLRLFDEDLPELTTEEEVEILYEILTKKKLFI